jgi:multiple sugar transport system permease protein
MKPNFQYRVIQWVKNLVVYGILAVACFVSLFPIIWGFTTSLKTERAVSAFPPQWIPDPATLENYREVAASIGRYMLNSGFVALATIFLTLIVAAHGAYAAARDDFPFKRFLLFLILATMMIPGVAILIPLYMVASKLGLFNTFSVIIIIYSTWMIPMALWLLRSFFETIPQDLEDAAIMDGCSPVGAFYRISVPLVIPGFTAVAIVVFIFVWNEFILALSMTSSEEKRLVTVGIYYYITAYGIEWGKLMAAVSLALVPIIGGFLLLQKGFIQGMTAGATRG